MQVVALDLLRRRVHGSVQIPTREPLRPFAALFRRRGAGQHHLREQRRAQRPLDAAAGDIDLAVRILDKLIDLYGMSVAGLAAGCGVVANKGVDFALLKPAQPGQEIVHIQLLRGRAGDVAFVHIHQIALHKHAGEPALVENVHGRGVAIQRVVDLRILPPRADEQRADGRETERIDLQMAAFLHDVTPRSMGLPQRKIGCPSCAPAS